MGLFYKLTKHLPSGGLCASTLDEFLEKVERMKIKNGSIEEFKVNSAEIPTWGPVEDEDGICGWSGYPIAIEFVLEYTVRFKNNQKAEFTEHLPIHLQSIDPGRIELGREKQRDISETRVKYLKGKNYSVESFAEYPASASQ